MIPESTPGGRHWPFCWLRINVNRKPHDENKPSYSRFEKPRRFNYVDDYSDDYDQQMNYIIQDDSIQSKE